MKDLITESFGELVKKLPAGTKVLLVTEASGSMSLFSANTPGLSDCVGMVESASIMLKEDLRGRLCGAERGLSLVK